MLDNLIKLDKRLFLSLNSKHVDWLDPLMILLSSYALWSAVFVVFGLLVFTSRKTNRIVSVLFYAGSVTFSTLFTNLLKLFVQRPRPIHEGAWQGLIHNIEKHSAAFSFFSSHSATTFCIAVFVYFYFRTKRYYGYLALLWAFGVSYSRIYVGKHYPLDVAVGILFGSFVGYLGYTLLQKYIEKER